MDNLFQLQTEVNKVIKGKESQVEMVLAAIIAGGHILMEDIPGVGKTTMANAFARAMSLDYKRVQFTPDVLPGDILGFSIYNADTKEFEFRKGAVFTNLFLADEINRTSPKTQSALLEVMEEGNATVEGATRKLPEPFVVIATQNPYGSSGTQMLPESQLDRFMIRISLGYPSHEDAVKVLKDDKLKLVNSVAGVMSRDDIAEIRKSVENIFVHDDLYDYIVSITEATRNSPLFSYGSSPRGAIALLKMSKAVALLRGRDFVTAGDVLDVLNPVLGHRVTLSKVAKGEGKTVERALFEMIKTVKPPRC